MDALRADRWEGPPEQKLLQAKGFSITRHDIAEIVELYSGHFRVKNLSNGKISGYIAKDHWVKVEELKKLAELPTQTKEKKPTQYVQAPAVKKDNARLQETESGSLRFNSDSSKDELEKTKQVSVAADPNPASGGAQSNPTSNTGETEAAPTIHVSQPAAAAASPTPRDGPTISTSNLDVASNAGDRSPSTPATALREFSSFTPRNADAPQVFDDPEVMAELKAAFSRFDLDEDNFLEMKELRSVLLWLGSSSIF